MRSGLWRLEENFCNGGQVIKNESNERDVNFQACPQPKIKIINFIHFLAPSPHQMRARERERGRKSWFKNENGKVLMTLFLGGRQSILYFLSIHLVGRIKVREREIEKSWGKEKWCFWHSHCADTHDDGSSAEQCGGEIQRLEMKIVKDNVSHFLVWKIIIVKLTKLWENPTRKGQKGSLTSMCKRKRNFLAIKLKRISVWFFPWWCLKGFSSFLITFSVLSH